MKILITGHSGLLGSTLAVRLLKAGHVVHGISRSNRNPISGVYDHHFDLQNVQTTQNAISNIAPDVVYHLSANASEAMGQKAPIDMTQRNMGIFMNVLRSSIDNKVKKFIYASSIAVYGETPSPYDEDSPTEPKDVYGINKLACEQILKVMSQVYNFKHTIFRPHNLYGERQNMSDPTRNVVALFMRRLMENKPCTLYGEGRMRRSFSYADDVADVFQQALHDDFNGITMNVGSDRPVTIKEFFNDLLALTGKSVEVSETPARPQEIFDFIANHRIQNKMCSYEDTPLLDGLMKTWIAVKDKQLPPLEVHKNEIENTLR
jgi:UDP-glucose 4-epimerase